METEQIPAMMVGWMEQIALVAQRKTSLPSSPSHPELEKRFNFPDTMDSPLKYTPVSVNKDNTADGQVYTVELLVENPSSQRESIPDFTLDEKNPNTGTK